MAKKTQEGRSSGVLELCVTTHEIVEIVQNSLHCTVVAQGHGELAAITSNGDSISVSSNLNRSPRDRRNNQGMIHDKRFSDNMEYGGLYGSLKTFFSDICRIVRNSSLMKLRQSTASGVKLGIFYVPQAFKMSSPQTSLVYVIVGGA